MKIEFIKEDGCYHTEMNGILLVGSMSSDKDKAYQKYLDIVKRNSKSHKKEVIESKEI